MGLSSGVTTLLTNPLKSMRTSLINGDGICPDLTFPYKSQVASLVAKGKVTTAQQTQIDNAIDSISAELNC